jgi:hypothetical protein
MSSEHSYDQIVQRSAHRFILGLLSEDHDEACDHFEQSQNALLQALALRGAKLEVGDQEFWRQSLVAQVGDEILDEARRQLFATVFPHCDGDLKLEIADAFDRMQQQFRARLTPPVLH